MLLIRSIYCYRLKICSTIVKMQQNVAFPAFGVLMSLPKTTHPPLANCWMRHCSRLSSDELMRIKLIAGLGVMHLWRYGMLCTAIRQVAKDWPSSLCCCILAAEELCVWGLLILKILHSSIQTTLLKKSMSRYSQKVRYNRATVYLKLGCFIRDDVTV